jgi:rRNA-processing protein FCF1
MGGKQAPGGRRKESQARGEARVILDTNFLIDLFRFKLRFEDLEDALNMPVRFFVMDRTVGELTGLNSKWARVALSYIESMGIGTIKASPVRNRKGEMVRPTVDDAIVALFERRAALSKAAADKEGTYVVATNDGRLRVRLRPFHVRTAYLRSRKHFEVH